MRSLRCLALSLSITAACGASVEPSSFDSAVTHDAAADVAVDVAIPPPFVSAPPSEGPYALCGAIGLGTVAAIEFDPSRDALAVGSYAGFVRIIDARDGHHIGTIFAHRYGLSSLAYSPDRTLLATTGSDFAARNVRLWSARDGAAVRSIALDSDPLSVVFTPDGSSLVVTQRNAVSRYRVSDGALEWSAREVEHPIDGSGVSPDGSSLAYISGSGITLLRLRDGSRGPTVTDSFMRNRRTIAFSRDGSSVIVGYQYYSPDGPSVPAVIARVIDVATSRTRVEIEGFRSVNALRVAPSGDEVAIAFEYRGYERWAVSRSGAWLPRAERRAGLALEQESRAIAFDREGARVALSSADAIRVFDAATNGDARESFESIAVLQGALGWGGGGSIELSTDGRELLVGTRDALHLFSVATQDVIRRFEQTRGVGAISPDGQSIVTGAASGRLALWRRSDWSVREVASVADLASVAFVDGARFVAAGRDSLVLHRASDGAEQRRWPITRRQLPAFDLRVSRDASRVAVSTYGGFGGGIDVFDLGTDAPVFNIAGNFRSRSNSAFMRDGRLLVAMAEGAPLALYSADGQRVNLSTAGTPATTIALTSDEQLLLSSTSNGITTIRRGLDGEVVQDLGRIGPSGTSSGNSLRISTDGAVIVRTGAQSTLEVWCRR